MKYDNFMQTAPDAVFELEDVLKGAKVKVKRDLVDGVPSKPVHGISGVRVMMIAADPNLKKKFFVYIDKLTMVSNLNQE